MFTSCSLSLFYKWPLLLLSFRFLALCYLFFFWEAGAFGVRVAFWVFSPLRFFLRPKYSLCILSFFVFFWKLGLPSLWSHFYPSFYIPNTISTTGYAPDTNAGCYWFPLRFWRVSYYKADELLGNEDCGSFLLGFLVLASNIMINASLLKRTVAENKIKT